VHGMDKKARAFVAFRHRTPGPAIIYFSLIQTLAKFSEVLGRLGIDHLVYHGQLQDRDRRRSQEAFLQSDNALILATPAFGLGVDKSNVRLVMHGEGRDGAPAECILLYDSDDVAIQLDFLNWANPDPGFIQGVYNLIDRNLVRARQEGFDYLRSQMNFYNRRDFRVETSVNLLERWGSLEGRQPREWQTVRPPPEEFMNEELYQIRMRGQKQKLYEMVHFAKLVEGCRMVEIARYFGLGSGFRGASSGNEVEITPCGICDLCLRGLGGDVE
jgi:ATP-dependent DNA helicase RecQ